MNFMKIKLNIGKEENKKKYDFDGGIMVNEFIYIYIYMNKYIIFVFLIIYYLNIIFIYFLINYLFFLLFTSSSTAQGGGGIFRIGNL